ncbi:MAG: hypothetical protein JXA52_03690 [Planctomycetes bacterium]|nr:hypothetical protein [Planctomycetota bacterium]
MAITALEENLTYSEIRQYSDKYLPQRRGFLCWLVHVTCHIMGLPSVYDYATRIAIAEEKLNRVNPFYKTASKLALEEILVNLTPKPDTVHATTLGLNAGSSEASALQSNLTPLNDEPVKNKDLVEKRYELLKRALKLYIQIGLEALLEAMEDEERMDYLGYYNRNLESAKKSADELARKRSSIYTDFPSERLRSVSDEVLFKVKLKANIREEMRATKLGVKIAADIGSLETQIRTTLRGILSKARLAIESNQKQEKKYIVAAKNIDFVKTAIAPNIPEEDIQEIDEELRQFIEEVKKYFNPEGMVPKDVFEDLRSQAKIYRHGEI